MSLFSSPFTFGRGKTMTMTYTHLKRVMGYCSLNRSKIKYLDPAIFNPYLLAVFLFWLLRKTWFSVLGWFELSWNDERKVVTKWTFSTSALPLMSSLLTLILEIWSMGLCGYFLNMSKVLLLCVICPYSIDLFIRKTTKILFVFCFIPWGLYYFWHSLMIWGYSLFLPLSSKPIPLCWEKRKEKH